MEWQNRGTNFTVSCLDLHLDQLPSKEDQEIMLSYCTYIPHLRALFEPTALYFGIPGNVVAIAAFMSMNPLRPASILLALVAIGDLITLIAGILPMEGNYHLSSARSVHYYWMHSFYAVASAFPHYALAILSVERASVAWRPVFEERLVTVFGAKMAGISMGIFSVLAIPMMAEAASSSFMGTHEFQMEIVIMTNIVPGLMILGFNVISVFGLLLHTATDTNESLISQVSLIMTAQNEGRSYDLITPKRRSSVHKLRLMTQIESESVVGAGNVSNSSTAAACGEDCKDNCTLGIRRRDSDDGGGDHSVGGGAIWKRRSIAQSVAGGRRKRRHSWRRLRWDEFSQNWDMTGERRTLRPDEHVLHGETWRERSNERAIGGEIWCELSNEQAIGGETWCELSNEQAIGGETWCECSNEQAIDVETWCECSNEQAIDVETRCECSNEQVIDGETSTEKGKYDTRIHERACDTGTFTGRRKEDLQERDMLDIQWNVSSNERSATAGASNEISMDQSLKRVTCHEDAFQQDLSNGRRNRPSRERVMTGCRRKRRLAEERMNDGEWNTHSNERWDERPNERGVIDGVWNERLSEGVNEPRVTGEQRNDHSLELDLSVQRSKKLLTEPDTSAEKWKECSEERCMNSELWNERFHPAAGWNKNSSEWDTTRGQWSKTSKERAMNGGRYTERCNERGVCYTACSERSVQQGVPGERWNDHPSKRNIRLERQGWCPTQQEAFGRCGERTENSGRWDGPGASGERWEEHGVDASDGRLSESSKAWDDRPWLERSNRGDNTWNEPSVDQSMTGEGWAGHFLEGGVNDEHSKVRSAERSAGSERWEDCSTERDTNRNAIDHLKNSRSILSSFPVDDDSYSEAQTMVKHIRVGRRESFGSSQSHSSVHPSDAADGDRQWSPSAKQSKTGRSSLLSTLLLEHSSLTRLSLLASILFFLMVWPLTVVTLIYHSWRGPDSSRPVENPVVMVRLVFLYELFAWICTLNNGLKVYVFMLGSSRFKKHFLFMMMRKARREARGEHRGSKDSSYFASSISSKPSSHAAPTPSLASAPASEIGKQRAAPVPNRHDRATSPMSHMTGYEASDMSTVESWKSPTSTNATTRDSDV